MLKTDEVRPVRPNLTQSMSVLSNDRHTFKFFLFFLACFHPASRRFVCSAALFFPAPLAPPRVSLKRGLFIPNVFQ